ncbi:MAG: GT2 family glycosyltransferase [Cryomorphaceae bacterium]|jgi:GT2 family glycosyltransferase
MPEEKMANVQSTHIVIVNYNAGDWLQRSISSALRFSTGQITVVDNDSTDGSLEIAQASFSDARINWQANTQNVGFAAANNQVIKTNDAEFLVLMNPDCELEENTLVELIAAFREHSQMGLASCRILNSDGSLQATSRRRFPTPWSAMVRMLQLHQVMPNNPRFASFDYGDRVDNTLGIEFVEAISGAFMVARKSAADQVGLLDEGYFMHCEDLDWCMRFSHSGWKVGFLPNVAVTHAKGVSSRSRPIAVLFTLHKGMDRFFDKFYKNDYPWLLRMVVKLGIAVSFIGRAGISLLKGLAR